MELDKYYGPWGLERALGRFVEHYNHQLYHESLDNVTPADAYHGRRKAILSRGEQIKTKTMAPRKRQNLRAA
ncbi:MAG: transposase [Candidatus Binatia bacterium]|nr:transposase [Candidatus Binatia bacterium]